VQDRKLTTEGVTFWERPSHCEHRILNRKIGKLQLAIIHYRKPWSTKTGSVNTFGTNVQTTSTVSAVLVKRAIEVRRDQMRIISKAENFLDWTQYK
jgi:hypothetical protein